MLQASKYSVTLLLLLLLQYQVVNLQPTQPILIESKDVFFNPYLICKVIVSKVMSTFWKTKYSAVQ